MTLKAKSSPLVRKGWLADLIEKIGEILTAQPASSGAGAS